MVKRCVARPHTFLNGHNSVALGGKMIDGNVVEWCWSDRCWYAWVQWEDGEISNERGPAGLSFGLEPGFKHVRLVNRVLFWY